MQKKNGRRLVGKCSGQQTSKQRESLDREIGYVENHKNRMDYKNGKDLGRSPRLRRHGVHLCPDLASRQMGVAVVGVNQ